VDAEDVGVSFDNAYYTHTYYLIHTEHHLRVRRSEHGESPRRGRRVRRRRT